MDPPNIDKICLLVCFIDASLIDYLLDFSNGLYKNSPHFIERKKIEKITKKSLKNFKENKRPA